MKSTGALRFSWCSPTPSSRQREVDRLGARLGELEVARASAGLVRITGDVDPGIGILLEVGGEARDGGAGLGRQRGAIGVEEEICGQGTGGSRAVGGDGGTGAGRGCTGSGIRRGGRLPTGRAAQSLRAGHRRCGERRPVHGRRTWRRDIGGGDVHRRPGRHADRAVDDDPLAGLQALVDEPVVALPVADFDDPLLDLFVLADHPDEVALGTLLHGALRHQDGVGTQGTEHAHAHELPGPQNRGRIRQHRAHEEGAGLLAERGIRETHAAAVGKHAAVGQHHLDFERAIGRDLEQPPRDLLAQPEQLILRHAVVHPDRIELRDRGEQVVRRVHVGAVLHLGKRR